VKTKQDAGDKNRFCTKQAHVLSKKKTERELKYVASPMLLPCLLVFIAIFVEVIQTQEK